ncbi:hypothetical protein DSO57_1001265 [Entomophthora muscae]|uniref:Uncharacterized protein n=1 Tax=Entomophthora muscae TaxID=34485 RepID=A0ACC2T8W1_9FUNG|nr:hypothetical protein DSO57_1001265 [Entomophthora muscae]
MASAIVAVKNGIAWCRSSNDQRHSNKPVKQVPPKPVKNLTSLVREPRAKQVKGLQISSSGFYGLNLPLKLDQQLHWTGKGDFSKAHRSVTPAKSQFHHTCTQNTPLRNNSSACFVKNVEGYMIPSSMHRSPPFTCKQRMCTITATFNLSNTIPFNNLSPENVLEITHPTNAPELAYPANQTTLTVTETFIGPGTRVILLKPILWSVKGLYLPTVPLGYPELNQTYVVANFLMLANGQIDAIYMLNEPKRPTTTPPQ